MNNAHESSKKSAQPQEHENLNKAKHKEEEHAFGKKNDTKKEPQKEGNNPVKAGQNPERNK